MEMQINDHSCWFTFFNQLERPPSKRDLNVISIVLYDLHCPQWLLSNGHHKIN